MSVKELDVPRLFILIFGREQSRYISTLRPKSNYKVYAYIVKHNYILGGMLFTICKAQLCVSATNVCHLQVVQ